MMSPFEAAVGREMEKAAPLVREHFGQREGTRRYSGCMTRVWCRKGWRRFAVWPGLWLSSRAQILFVEAGIEIPFELENTIGLEPEGLVTMSWVRSFQFPKCARKFPAYMRYDAKRGAIIDWLGASSCLEVELHARVEAEAMLIESGRQWMRRGDRRVKVPLGLQGRARVREWQTAEDTLGIRVTIENRLLGPFFGYEGTFAQVGSEVEGDQAV